MLQLHMLSLFFGTLRWDLLKHILKTHAMAEDHQRCEKNTGNFPYHFVSITNKDMVHYVYHRFYMFILYKLIYTRKHAILWDNSTCLNPCKKIAKGEHEESEPRSVGIFANAHGITLLLQRAKRQEPQLRM